jgi:hypothetical protein
LRQKETQLKFNLLKLKLGEYIIMKKEKFYCISSTGGIQLLTFFDKSRMLKSRIRISVGDLDPVEVAAQKDFQSSDRGWVVTHKNIRS